MTTTIRRPDGNLDSLVFDLVEWVGKEPRSYTQTMEAWRTSCPRLTVWEEAVDRGLLMRTPGPSGGRVAVTGAGHAFLVTHGHTTGPRKKGPQKE